MKKHNSKKINTIVLSTGVVIFSLAAAFSGTIAWFNTTKAATVNAGTFTVVAPEGVNYDLYYLDHFLDEEENTQPGNFNPSPSVNLFTGYEIDYANAVFTKVTYNQNGTVSNNPDPTDVMHLWPAHKLTYALAVSGSPISTLSLSDWSESVGEAVTNLGNHISLTWAINLYGKAYGSNASGNPASDIANAYSAYRTDQKSDAFNYSEGQVVPSSVDIIDNISVNQALTIVFFTIEFSNDPSTFYSYDKDTGIYTSSESGNSNCYERLGFNKLEFAIS